MSQPVVVSIPHKLGKEEATRRLQAGLGKARETFGGMLTQFEGDWAGNHADLRIGMLGQTANGTVDVEDDHVRLEVQLPWALALMAEKAKAMIQKQGQLMLEKK